MTRMFLTILLLVACGIPAAARPQRVEGITAVDDTSRTEFGPKGFTRNVIDSLTKAQVHVDSLGALPPKIWILEGGSFELKYLDVRAATAGGETVRGAPIALELESLIATIGLDRIMGYQPGQARLAITSGIPRRDGKSVAQTFVDIEVYAR